MTDVRVIENITKDYNGMIKVMIYKTPRVFVRSSSQKDFSKTDYENYTPSVSSLCRTKTMIHDLVLCNDFELFCTFTFNPKKVDSMNLHKTWRVMSMWLHHQSALSHDLGIDFKYLIIPEQHKSGAWHYHALISGYSSTLKDSGIKSNSLRPIYNVTSFRSGFTTAVRIDSKDAVSNYVTKYITKDFVKRFNQRRFFCSRNLVRPVKTVNNPLFLHTPPLFRHKTFETQDSIFFDLTAI